MTTNIHKEIIDTPRTSLITNVFDVSASKTPITANPPTLQPWEEECAIMIRPHSDAQSSNDIHVPRRR
jgi:hypothetical protein